MKRRLVNATVLLIAALSFAAPTLLSVQIAKTEGISSETARVMGYARDVVEHSDRTASQVTQSLKQLSDLDAAYRHGT
ncbi:hypothetical protein GCM10011348_46530 [Marinobacterium nitratireducens]|uniref:Methyl-accepting chemotaxis protein n=1 Tax=Marinobacterium nitratireducens TaxID=518897 RepID=A0A917ZRK2_9GAMM|nr:hypothetical protein [Marinobacterium nitratireducens]GGO89244.1 hypothetical protein GCM10011348_46530 [Marinobacterium nitratireducens]